MLKVGRYQPHKIQSSHLKKTNVQSLHWSFGLIGISPLTPSTRFKIQKKNNNLGFTNASSKVHFRSTEGQTFYWSIMTVDDGHQMLVRELRHDRPRGWFSKSRGLSASVSFLSSSPPPRSFTCATFLAVFDFRSSFFSPKPHRNACYAGYANHDSCNPARRLTCSEFKPCYATLIRRGTRAPQKEVSQKTSFHMSSTDFLAFIDHCKYFLTYRIPWTL